LCVVLGAVFLVAGLGEASAYRISGSSYDSRSLSTSESGTSEADAQWHGSDGADLNAWAWDADSKCKAVAVWTYDLGSASGSLGIEWCFHVNAEFDVSGSGLAYCMFWFELWDSGGRVGSSTTKSYSSDLDSDKKIDKTFNSLPQDSYTVKVLGGARAVSDTDGSSAEADAYYGPLQVTSKWLEVT
jgi:hypothetical protein